MEELEESVCGVLCDRRMKVKIKGNVYKTIVRPAMVCMGGEEGAREEDGGRRNENVTMDVRRCH